jgi:hypothetical protein
MALTTAVSSGPDMACMAAQDVSPLGGMVPMYLLMSAFHSAPWLKLVSSRRGGGRRSDPALAARPAFNRQEFPMEWLRRHDQYDKR